MSLGSSLSRWRKAGGLSQEETAEKLGVSRQTISKWEQEETIPDIQQCKKLAAAYHVSLDQLIEFDLETYEIQQAIDRVSEQTQKSVDWNQVWSRRYPILATYRQEVAVDQYARPLRALLDQLKREHGYGEEDAFLVLKDILAQLRKPGG